MRAGALTGLAIALGLGCATAPAPGASAAKDAASSSTVSVAAPAAADPLGLAVTQYREEGELEPLRRWLTDHPEHPDAEVWRELVAMRMYASLVLGDPFGDAHPESGEDPAVEPLPEPSTEALGLLASAYPTTIGGRTAAAHLDLENIRHLREPVLNERVAHFLAGEDDGFVGATVDPRQFRLRHAALLRQGVAVALRAEGCAANMGYCNWWITTFPDDPATPEIREARSQVWKSRAFPPWRSKRYATCALRCARRCRLAAVPLDDSCFEPCFSTCE